MSRRVTEGAAKACLNITSAQDNLQAFFNNSADKDFPVAVHNEMQKVLEQAAKDLMTIALRESAK